MKKSIVFLCVYFVFIFFVAPNVAFSWSLFGHTENKKIDEAFEKGREYQKEQDKKTWYNPKSLLDTDKQKKIKDEKDKLKDKGNKK